MEECNWEYYKTESITLFRQKIDMKEYYQHFMHNYNL